MKINYKPEINGLRAIFICAVILYHYNLNFFNGGIIGVNNAGTFYINKIIE